jgi:RNA polymerase sigma factor (sigma-70 family)
MDSVTTLEERRHLLERMVAEQPGRLARKMRSAGHEGADVDDLAQEVLLRAVRALRGLRGPTDEALVCAWVDRIATNVSLNARRTLARAPRTDPIRPDVGDEPLTPDEADAVACRRSLADLLADLPDEQRAVFVARVLEERTTAQVAVELAISEDLVRWRLRTARQRLRARVDAALASG